MALAPSFSVGVAPCICRPLAVRTIAPRRFAVRAGVPGRQASPRRLVAASPWIIGKIFAEHGACDTYCPFYSAKVDSISILHFLRFFAAQGELIRALGRRVITMSPLLQKTSMALCGFIVALAVVRSAVAQDASSNAATPATVGPRQTYRLGFTGAITERGLRVVRIAPDAPVLHMIASDDSQVHGMLDVGDVVVKIDGRDIRSLNDYFDAMDASVDRQGAVEILVWDVRTHGTRAWRAVGESTIVEAASAVDQIRRCHFVLIGLTSDRKIGRAETVNIERMNGLCESIRPERRGGEGVQTLTGANCNRARILQTVANLPVSNLDTLFVYYGGHGAHDEIHATPGDPSQGHFFQIPTGNLWRRDLWQAMATKNARLTVLITDTCNKKGSFLPESPFNYGEQSVAETGRSALETLLLGYRGVVDINGASPDQFGWCQPDQGGWFTLHLGDVLSENNDWNLAFDRTSALVEEYFNNKKGWACTNVNQLALEPDVRLRMCNPDTHQKPYKFQLQVYRDDDSLPSSEEVETRQVRVPSWSEPAMAAP